MCQFLTPHDSRSPKFHGLVSLSFPNSVVANASFHFSFRLSSKVFYSCQLGPSYSLEFAFTASPHVQFRDFLIIMILFVGSPVQSFCFLHVLFPHSHSPSDTASHDFS
jgi:hypothetical protein